jgi:hypothetical protein
MIPIAQKKATWDLFVVWQRGKTADPLRSLLECLQSKPKAPLGLKHLKRSRTSPAKVRNG